MPVGRPTKYTNELARAICDKIASGRTLQSIADEPDMPSRTTIYDWRMDNDEFLAMYAKARAQQLEVYEDDILHTAMNMGENVPHGRLIIDAKKWIMAKRDPKQYGDKQEIDHNVTRIVVERRKAKPQPDEDSE